MIVRIVKMHFRNDCVNSFLDLFEQNKLKIARFKGCRKLQLLRMENDGDVFFTYSYWESNAHLKEYRDSKLFKEIWSQTKVLFKEKAEAWTTHVTFDTE